MTTELIISAAALIILAAVTPLCNIFFRKITAVRQADETPEMPKVSVLLTAFGHSEQLENHLPAFLTQEYGNDYEVIVVAEKGDAETEDVLKRVADNPHLYITFIPDSSRYMSRKKLSVTLGVKAAKHEWIIMTDPSTAPTDSHWLQSMAVHFTEKNNLVMGYTQYEADTPSYYQFEHFRTACYLMRKARKGRAFRTNMPLIAFKKSEFLERNGFQGNLKYIRGEYDFMVNKYAQRGMTAVATAPETRLTESCPSLKTWRNKHIYYQETKKHLERRFMPRLTYRFDMAMMYLNYVAILGALTYSLFTQEWLLTAAAAAALLITIILRTVIARKAMRRFDLSIPAWKVTLYELRLPWTYLLAKIRYLRADKYDFISHKL